MRIGYVVKRYPRYSETFIVNEILAHEAAGLELVIYALLPPQDTHFQDLISRVRAPVYYLPDRSGTGSELWSDLRAGLGGDLRRWQALADVADGNARVMRQAAALARLVGEHHIDHLHAHFATASTAVARIAARLTGTGYSFTAHAKDIFHQSVDQQALRRRLADASFAVTVSDYNLRDLRRRFGADTAGLSRLYNGLDLQRFDYQPPPAGSRSILGIGRLVEKKGFRYLVAACRLLAERGVDFDCRIIGHGDEQTALAQQIHRLNLADRVQLLGPLPQAQVVEQLRQAAVLAAPCINGRDGNRDGLPTVLLEAMALGTPCVSTAVTGIPEAVRDGRTGLLLEPEDPEALADALQRLLQRPQLRQSLARGARQMMQTEFDVHQNSAELRQLFASTVQAGACAREAVR